MRVCDNDFKGKLKGNNCSREFEGNFFSSSRELRVGSTVYYFCSSLCRDEFKEGHNYDPYDHSP